jgi:hypothetical protein
MATRPTPRRHVVIAKFHRNAALLRFIRNTNAGRALRSPDT